MGGVWGEVCVVWASGGGGGGGGGEGGGAGGLVNLFDKEPILFRGRYFSIN